MLLRNAVLYRDQTFLQGDLAFANGRFVTPSASDDSLDLSGRTIIPGLVDIHFHGNSGVDFCDGSYDGLVKIARFLARSGITSFSPASMTLPEARLQAAFATAIRLRREQPAQAARLYGITMEGPFFNAAKKGAQNADYLMLPDLDFFNRLAETAAGLIRIACIAPELPGAIEFIEQVSRRCTVAVAHTSADYDTAKAGFDAGARHVTHLFNAMPPFVHRAPGVIGAAADHPAVTAELITDGIHIHPSVVRAAFKIFGAERMILVSDSMAACGMSDGEYDLGGQRVRVSGRTAALADGTIAGSATHLFDCLRTAISFGIRPEDAIAAATINPARVIGADREIGSIAPGKSADFVICKPDWSIEAVYVAGEPIRL